MPQYHPLCGSDILAKIVTRSHKNTALDSTYHSIRLSGMPSSFAMEGRATVVRPLSKVEMAVMSVTDVIMMAVPALEVTVVSVRSRLCRE